VGNVYSVIQKDIVNADADFDLPIAMKARAILDTQAPVFGEDDLTMTDVMANSDGGGAISASIEADVALTGQITTQVTNGVNLSADKVTFLLVAGGETFAVIILYDASNDASDATRIPIAFYDLSPDLVANGSDIEIRWSGTDGVGIFATARNA
jgi:hypothetical protein